MVKVKVNVKDVQQNRMKDLSYAERLKRLKLPTRIFVGIWSKSINYCTINMYDMLTSSCSSTSKFIKLHRWYNAQSERTRGGVGGGGGGGGWGGGGGGGWGGGGGAQGGGAEGGGAASVVSNRLDKHWSREPIVYDYEAPPLTRWRNYMDVVMKIPRSKPK